MTSFFVYRGVFTRVDCEEAVRRGNPPDRGKMYEKRTNALTNRPELLGDCHTSVRTGFAMTVLF